jgi:hypothetical protein
MPGAFNWVYVDHWIDGAVARPRRYWQPKVAASVPAR